MRSTFWDAPYRPLFTAAALWALICIAWWPLGANFGLPEPGFQPVELWHVHELIFGFAAAAVGGYLLTAVPSWVKTEPESGLSLQWLMVTWLASRLAMTCADALPLALLLPLNALYFLTLSGLLLLRLLQGGAKAKALFGVGILVMGTAEATFVILAKQGDVAGALMLSQGILIGFALLLTFIGTRLIPAFTRNWLLRTGAMEQVRERPAIRRAALATLVLAMAGLITDHLVLTNTALTAAGGLTLWVMLGWRSTATRGDALLGGLHSAYLWLPIGLMLIGITGLWPHIYPAASAKHALTIGAMAGLIMAISGRAAAHMPSGNLQAPKPLTAAMILLAISTLARLLAPLPEAGEAALILLASVFWCAAWAAYLIAYCRTLTGPPVRPVLSGKKIEPTGP
ncbi:MAG: NnrS family protein [Shimia sp.]|nr:NnrS family protein [Shimia sp.]